ncbi:MAG: AI-2E family transporter [Candidatus Bipolaricaulia bacterium]
MQELIVTRWLRWTIALVVLVLLVWFVYAIRSILTSLLLAFIIAYVFSPFVDFLERHRVKRGWGTLIVILSLGSLLALFILFAAPPLAREFAEVGERLPNYREIFNERLFPFLEERFDINLEERFTGLLESLEENRELLQDIGSRVLGPLFRFVRSGISGLVSSIIILVNLMLVPVMAVYLLKDMNRVRRWAVDSLPQGNRSQWKAKLREIDELLGGYLRGQLLVALILGVLYTIGLSILRVPLAPFVGFVAGLANMIPFFGLLVGIVPASLLAYLEHGTWQPIVGVLGVFTIPQLLENWLITPRIVGKRVELHPVAIILAIVIWGFFFGFFGMLIAVPLTAAGNVLFKSLMERYKESEFYRSESAGAGR